MAKAKTTTKRKKKGKLADALILVVFGVGLLVLLYPAISNYVNTLDQGRAIATYDSALAEMSTEDYSQAWAAADAYNEAITKYGISFAPLAEEYQEIYADTLDPAGTGMMGHIEISKIGVDLPIYHGVDEAVLQIGVGHIEQSSLPTGGESTHTLLSGHRGLPTSHLFTDLDQLEEGDVFLLHVLDKTLAYEVDQIRIVLPEEVNELAIVEGEDLCTLITCTPYAINTHRLLVRGHRVEYLNRAYVAADATIVDSLLVSSVVSVPIFAVLLVALFVRTRAKKNKVTLDAK